MRSSKLQDRIYFLSSCFLLMFVVEANANPMDQYLFEDNEYSAATARIRLPDAPTAHWLQDPELRISPEEDVMDMRSETYELRFRPTSRKERTATRELFSIENKIASAELEKTLSEALAGRYHDLIDLADKEVQVALAREHLSLARSILDSEQSLSASSNYSSARLQSAFIDVDLQQREFQRATRQAEQLRDATIAGYLSVSSEVLPQISRRLIQPEMVERFLTDVSSEAATNSLDSSMARLEIRRAQKEVALDKSRKAFGLSLMELGYEDKRTDSYRLTFGFRFPFSRRTYGSQVRARELSTAIYNAHLTDRALSAAVEDKTRETRWQIDAYESDVTALQALTNRLQESSAEVSVLSVLRRHQLELLDSAANNHVRILHNFIELIELAGLLHQSSEQNWIGGDNGD